MNDVLLDRTDREDLAIYVVWVPELGGEERHIPDATRLMPDPRARHYWDPGEHVGRLYARLLLGTDGPPLWDVYFLFDRMARWSDDPPSPEFWSHQLRGLDPAPRFDPEEFSERALMLLQEDAAVEAIPEEAGAASAEEDGP